MASNREAVPTAPRSRSVENVLPAIRHLETVAAHDDPDGQSREDSSHGPAASTFHQRCPYGCEVLHPLLRGMPIARAGGSVLEAITVMRGLDESCRSCGDAMTTAAGAIECSPYQFNNESDRQVVCGPVEEK